MAFAVPTFAAKGWTPVSKEQAEYNAIQMQIAQVNEQFTALGGYNSSARQAAIFQLLKNIGTPVTYKILKELVESGELSGSYLNHA